MQGHNEHKCLKKYAKIYIFFIINRNMQNWKQTKRQGDKRIALPYLAFTVWGHGNTTYY